jgi:hypothetical protein
MLSALLFGPACMVSSSAAAAGLAVTRVGWGPRGRGEHGGDGAEGRRGERARTRAVGLPRGVIVLIGLAAAVVTVAGVRATVWLIGPAFLALTIVIAISPVQGCYGEKGYRAGCPCWPWCSAARPARGCGDRGYLERDVTARVPGRPPAVPAAGPRCRRRVRPRRARRARLACWTWAPDLAVPSLSQATVRKAATAVQCIRTPLGRLG